MFNSGLLLTIFVFFSQNFLISTKNLSGAAIVIFRKFLRSSSLLTFCKIGVLITSSKFLGKHICRSLFNKVVELLDWNFKLKTASGIFFSMNFAKGVKNTSLQDPSRRLLLIFRKLDIQTFNSKKICSLVKYMYVDFRTSMLQLSNLAWKI